MKKSEAFVAFFLTKMLQIRAEGEFRNSSRVQKFLISKLNVKY